MSLLDVVSNAPVGIFPATLADSVNRYMNNEKFSIAGAFVSITFIISLLNVLISFFAFYLAFKCSCKNGNTVAHMLGACCCGIFYIVYALASGDCFN